jgi:hypothetical protein
MDLVGIFMSSFSFFSRNKYNLNDMSHGKSLHSSLDLIIFVFSVDAALELIQLVLDQSVNVTQV